MNIHQLIEANKEQFYQDLNEVIQIKSVKGAPEKTAPFGRGPKAALEKALSLSENYGFKTANVEDAVGYAQWGNDSEYIGIVGHLDVVPEGAGWSFPPYRLTKKAGRFYARGILDNKGPIIACLYGMKLLKEAGFVPKKTIRILFGTDEESGSSDIPMYLSQEKPPTFGFTPDCKYPVVYGERGIVNYQILTTFDAQELNQLGNFDGDQAKDHVPDQLSVTINQEEVTVSGKRAPSNAPELGENAITLLAEKIMNDQLVTGELQNYFSWIADSLANQHNGEGLALNFEDKDSGKLILTPYELLKTETGLALSIAIRYPVSIAEEEVTQKLLKQLPKNSTMNVVRRIKSSSFPKNNPFVQKLSAVYEDVTKEDGTPVTTTGATYARSMPNIVAFGPSFPGQKGIAHNQDEYMDENDLLLNLEIYMRAIIALTE
ncbi:M20 family metallopeptidase [Candidatus Enterococcus courvalinii]|uniref:M20 family metallopeptidase n=1 Tax=Candidatus Enterococcus courvalinii TaxID=2815329 RepID=A0ABS3HXC7_9ENTE|nr:M20 family metallopeptidase [Enterococcus sp. MSG2901]MBO0481114.1 M20 family metallopeptidase [Enterococcus sp. MSG2901]